jgi:hypothetical protein
MKIHRLTLTNYRGIAHRDIEFPDRGVVVVGGANEIGKSSMIEAIDLLLEHKDRSARKEVKQVKPTHADVGAEVTAEISTGPYRFEYYKRFHKRAETRLSILAPRREQLTGDEAHERVLAMLEQTVDTDLWKAQRILQSEATAPVDLAGCNALSRALDVAAGVAAVSALSGVEPLLIDRIDTEYLLYHTPTGRPTGAWVAAVSRLKEAESDVARCQAAVAEVDGAVSRHADLTGQLTDATTQLDAASERLIQARAAADAIFAIRAELQQAQLVSDAAHATAKATQSALAERRRMCAEVGERCGVITELRSTAELSAKNEAAAVAAQQVADVASTGSRAALDASQKRAELARTAVDQLAERAEMDRLTDQLGRIEAAAALLAETQAQLSEIALTDAAMQAITTAATAVDRAAAQAEHASGRIELIAVTDVELRVNGDALGLAAGKQWSTGAGGQIDIEVPGVLSVRVLPGTPAATTQAALDDARSALSTALTPFKLADVQAARALDERRRELTSLRDQQRASWQATLGNNTAEALTGRLAELTERHGAEPVGDPEAIRAELQLAITEQRTAAADYDAARDAAAQAAQAVADARTEATAAREKLAAAESTLAEVTERLVRQRADEGDDALASRTQAEADRAQTVAGQVQQLDAALTVAAAESVDAEFADATAQSDRLVAYHGQLAEELRDVTTQLKVYGTQGRQSQLDAAQGERRHAESDHTALRRRAQAARTLREVMDRHRNQARQRYVEPFRQEIERLGRIVFGDSFEVAIDSDLRICSRTVAGRTVPYESLSGGAKEQLGIVARLAGAVLVAKEDSVPVIIDDALGFSDAGRLARMGEVFDAVGGDGQVIVLTCSPDRYASVADAVRIDLSA